MINRERSFFVYDRFFVILLCFLIPTHMRYYASSEELFEVNKTHVKLYAIQTI